MRNMEVVAFPDGALRAPDYVDSKSLAANTNETVTVPTGAAFVVFSSNVDFYASYDGDDAVVPGDVADGTSNELNPTVRYIAGVTEIDLISASAGIVTMAFYKA